MTPPSPFEAFPKIHPIWYRHPSLNKNLFTTWNGWENIKRDCCPVSLFVCDVTFIKIMIWVSQYVNNCRECHKRLREGVRRKMTFNDDNEVDGYKGLMMICKPIMYLIWNVNMSVVKKIWTLLFNLIAWYWVDWKSPR